MIKSIFYLILQDFKLDFRQKYAFGAIILYLISTVYIVYRVFDSLSAETWLGIYWIVYLLVALSIVLKSFVLSSRGMAIYYYSLYNPWHYLLAKIIYNTMLLILMGASLFFLLILFSSNPVLAYDYFIGTMVLASLGISVIFSFISSIVSNQHQNNVMMAILSLPLIIPILLLSLHISGKSIGTVIDLSISDEITLLSGIILVMLGLAMLLFPNIWRS